MPVKRRIEKRRLDPEAELEIWSSVFGAGCDFFGEAAEHTGLLEPVRADMGRARDEAAVSWLAAAGEVWGRLGERFLLTDRLDRMAWAEEQFGRPWEASASGRRQTRSLS